VVVGAKNRNRSDKEALRSVIVQAQTIMKNELAFKHIPIPNPRAEAKCNIFVTSNYNTCTKLCVFMQFGKGGMTSLGYEKRKGFENENEFCVLC
jgi:hypothetical protein